MLNGIWACMILIAVLFGAATGRMGDVTNAALDSAGEAVSLCLTMAGVVALWMGLMEIAQRAGLINKLTKGIAPFLKFLFPRIPQGHPAGEYIAANVIANVLGLGWACTPAGLKAMEELAQLEAQRGNPEYLETEGDFGGKYRAEKGVDGRKVRQEGAQKDWSCRNRQQKGNRRENMGGSRHASSEMCTFLILNISSLQLIPVNMIAYRSQYGSANPTAVIAPAIAATLVSTLVAIVYCKLKDCTGRGRAGKQYTGEEYIRKGFTNKDYAGIGRAGKDSIGELTASESRMASPSGFGLRQSGTAGVFSGKRKGRGGKAV